MAPNETLYRKFRRKAFAVNTFDKVLDSSGGTMRRTLTAFQLVLLGIGTMVGAGLFVATGVAAKDKAGPGIILSYIIAGISCTLSALCYAEFACEYPIAGGAFNYITLTFGEFAGWIVACQLFIEWTLANAAVAKGFSGYLGNLCGIPKSVFVVYKYNFVQPGPSLSGGFGIEVDWLSVVFLVVLTGVMLLGTKESALAQNISVSVYMVIILITVIAGGSKVKTENYSPFLPYGAKGIFRGASNVFFSYIGFDMVASMAEECLHPNRDLPIGIIGSLGAATAIYVGMSTVLTGMVKYSDLDDDAPFAQAFRDIPGMKWAAIIVALGAVLGVANSEFGGLLGQSRIFVTMGRAGLLPPAIAKVDAKRATPYVAILVSGSIAAVLALLLNIDILTDFVSMGTLFAYMTVCIGVLWRRYYVKGETAGWVTSLMAVLIVEMMGCGLVMGFTYNYDQPAVFYVTPIFMFFTIMLTFAFLPKKLSTTTFHCPWVPIVPGCGIMINLLLIGSLNVYAYYFWIGWVSLSIAIYLLYGIHHTQGEGKPVDLSISQTDREMEMAVNEDRLGVNQQRAVLGGGGTSAARDDDVDMEMDKSTVNSAAAGYRPSGQSLFQRASFT